MVKGTGIRIFVYGTITFVCLLPFELTFWQTFGISVLSALAAEMFAVIALYLEAIKKSLEDVDTRMKEIDIELEDETECCGGTGGEKCHCKNLNQSNKDGKN